MVVVPTAITRRASARARFTASATEVGIETRSGGSAWSSIRAAWIERNVPGPTCSVSSWTSTPRRSRRRRTAGVKCRPAVGAATEPDERAYTVWYRSRSSAVGVANRAM